MRTIEGHHDFAVLEDRLAALIREAHAGGRAAPFPGVAVIAPTRGLLSHLRITLAERLPVLANVHFFSHLSLAGAAGAAAGSPAPTLLGEDARMMVLSRLIEARGGPLADYTGSRPGSLASILSTLDDLREAAVPSGSAAKLKGLSARAQPILDLHAAYSERLDAKASRVADRARWIRESAPDVTRYCRRFALVIHYGAYDLIGVNLGLMRAVEASGARLVFLVPHHATSPAYDLARQFWPEMLGARPVPLPDAPSDRLLSAGLPFLYQEGAGPAPLDSGAAPRVRFFHAQGAAAELREVALDVLSLRGGPAIPLHRVGVIARSLEPYAPWLRPIFAEHALPFTTSQALGAVREGRVQAALQLARAALRDYPRQPLMDLLHGGLLRIEGRDPSPGAHAWDRLGRAWQISGGYRTWAEDLPRWIRDWEPYVSPDATEEERARQAARKAILSKDAASLASVVDHLRRAARPLDGASSWSAWAEGMETLLAAHLDGFDSPAVGAPPDPGVAAVLGVLREMGHLDAAGVPPAPNAALAFFERALARATVPIGSHGGDAAARDQDNGGVRVLDAMQARGRAFDAVYLIGFNADQFPRRTTEDPFLPDRDRRLLRERLGVPVPVKTAAPLEERLLLAHLMGSARLRLTVSWQRADDSARARVASLALREVARMVHGTPILKQVVPGARRVKAHPAEASEDAVRRFGMLPPLDACVGVALEARSPGRLLEICADLPLPPVRPGFTDVLRAGLVMMRAIDAWTGTDVARLRFDAFAGEAAQKPGPLSPSRLELLGSCPQHYFFRHVLRAKEMEEVREGYELDPREIGSVVHAVLHDVYRELSAPDGRLAAADDRPARAVELARRSWDGRARVLAARTRARFPILWETTESIWLKAIADFLARDLPALQRQEARLAGLEREAAAGIPLGTSGASLEVRGRFDRVVAGPEGVVVSDYKTSGSIERHVDAKRMLKGLSLQMPLYLLLAESLAARGEMDAPARGEVLGVGPRYDGDSRDTLEIATLDKHRAGLLETLGVLAGLSAGGTFPLNEASWLCEHCPYTRACRRWHVPTLARLASAPAAADYALVRRKNTRQPTLEMVRRLGGEEEA
jgi:RecB family exonuclease